MTDDRTFDRLTRAWLDLMPDEAPDRTVEAVLQAVVTTPQVRRPWRWLPWRSTPMNRATLAIGTTAVVVAAAALYFGISNSSSNVGYAFENNLGNGDVKYTSEAAAHEAGHLFGLSHQAHTAGRGREKERTARDHIAVIVYVCVARQEPGRLNLG